MIKHILGQILDEKKVTKGLTMMMIIILIGFCWPRLPRQGYCVVLDSL
jgi:hypothetical protein